MTQLLINIGRTANDRSGDPLRLAFDKINQNFTQLFGNISAVSVAVGATPPASPMSGTLWWDSTDGNLYVHYGSTWVEAMAPTINLTTLKSIAAASTNFSDFQARIAAL